MGTGYSSEKAPMALPGQGSVAAALEAGADNAGYSMSNGVLYAYKFTQRHPLFQWSETQNVAQDMGSSSSKLHVLVDIADMSGDVSGRGLLSVLPASSSLLLSAAFSAHPSSYKLKALLVSLRHPCILPVLDVDKQHGDHSIVIVAQPFVPTGSIKDLIYCNPVPANEYSAKYNRPGRGVPRTLISRYGRHVLEALRALESIGVVCDHLTAGNVMLDQDIARVSDVFNPILGIDRDVRLQQLTLPLEAAVPLDLLLFGHFLFEMAMGRELLAVAPSESDLTGKLPLDVADVLRRIFFPSTAGLLSVQDLVDMPLFASAHVPPSFSSHTQMLDAASTALLQSSLRLNQDRRWRRVHDFQEAILQAAKKKADMDGALSARRSNALRTGSAKKPPHRRVSYRRTTSLPTSATA